MRDGTAYVDEIWAPRLNPEVDTILSVELLWKRRSDDATVVAQLSAELWTARQRVL